MANKWTITLDFKRSTKNTHMFQAPNDDAPVSTLYVSKTDMGDVAPDSIKVVLSW